MLWAEISGLGITRILGEKILKERILGESKR
jgi:hypothetical protein